MSIYVIEEVIKMVACTTGARYDSILLMNLKGECSFTGWGIQ